MAKTATLQISDVTYEAVQKYSHADGHSMNSWLENILSIEDMRRRCAAHGASMRARPEEAQQIVDFSEAHLQTLADAGLLGEHGEGDMLFKILATPDH